jgi:hypothetical protein
MLEIKVESPMTVRNEWLEPVTITTAGWYIYGQMKGTSSDPQIMFDALEE